MALHIIDLTENFIALWTSPTNACLLLCPLFYCLWRSFVLRFIQNSRLCPVSKYPQGQLDDLYWKSGRLSLGRTFPRQLLADIQELAWSGRSRLRSLAFAPENSVLQRYIRTAYLLISSLRYQDFQVLRLGLRAPRTGRHCRLSGSGYSTICVRCCMQYAM